MMASPDLDALVASLELVAARVVRPASPALAWISVSIMPGLTALTRMPRPPSSREAPMVKLSMAPLEAA